MTQAERDQRPTGTAAARRDRVVTFGVSTAVVAKGIGLVAPLIITPACFRYLGEQRYGLWMAITALTAMAWFTDLGLGNSLLTRLGQLADDIRQQAREISSAYATVGSVAACLFAGLAMINALIPWVSIFGVTDPAVADETSAMVLVCFGAFALNMPLSLIQRVQYARGQVVRSNVWQTAGALISVAAVLGAIAAALPPLVVISCAVFSLPLTNLLNSLVYYGFQAPAVRPQLRMVDRATLTGLLRLGVRFFTLTTISAIANNLDSPLIAWALGLDVAAHYALVAKLFGVVTMFIVLVGLTVWPVNGAALTKGDVAWVRRNTGRMTLLYCLIVAILGVGLTVLGHWILASWVGSVDLELVPVPVFGGLAAYTLIMAAAYPMIMVQNSVGLLRAQFLGWLAFLPLATGLKVVGLDLFGVAAVPISAFIAYALTMLPAVIIGYRRTLRTFSPLGADVRPRSDAPPGHEGATDAS